MEFVEERFLKLCVPVSGVKYNHSLAIDGEWPFIKQKIWKAKYGNAKTNKLHLLMIIITVAAVKSKNPAKIEFAIKVTSSILYNLFPSENKIFCLFFETLRWFAKYFIAAIGYITCSKKNKNKTKNKVDAIPFFGVVKSAAITRTKNTTVGTTAEITQSFLLTVQNFCFSVGTTGAIGAICVLAAFNFLAIIVTNYNKSQLQYYNETLIRPSTLLLCSGYKMRNFCS